MCDLKRATSKKCFIPWNGNKTVCEGRGYTYCENCVKRPLMIPVCFKNDLGNLELKCYDDECRVKDECRYYNVPECFKSAKPMLFTCNSYMCDDPNCTLRN